MTNFNDFGISPNILTVLTKNGFEIPTPIQAQAIPLGIEGKDIIGIAQTGTGKTLAFAVPMIQKVLTSGAGLVLLPTRELALQVEELFKKVGKPVGVRTALLIGGQSLFNQKRTLNQDPHVIVATPGRLCDHLRQGNISLKNVNILVLDEADRMFDMGFAPQLEAIFSALGQNPSRQTMLFSATMPEGVVRISQQYMNEPTRVEIEVIGSVSEQIDQFLYVVKKDSKPHLLHEILEEYDGNAIVFMRTKFSAAKLAKTLSSKSHSAIEIHSNKSLGQRREALEGFKTGKYRVLVATDVASRGIDVAGLKLVINYDLPEDAADYVHRIGRTGRAGKSGVAISFASNDQSRMVRDIQRLIKKELPVLEHEDYSDVMTLRSAPSKSSGGYRKGGYSSSSNYSKNSSRGQKRYYSN